MDRRIGEYIIRDWRMKDAPTLAKYANNRKIWMNLRDAFPHPYGLEDAESFISRSIESNPKTIFAIATQSEGRVFLRIIRYLISSCSVIHQRQDR
jgi:RimJ/RimL family protein N-acetyltransferase